MMSLSEQGGASDCDDQRCVRTSDATFIGWQENQLGELFPLYTVTRASHSLFNSTVSDSTLQAMHLRIPRTPTPYGKVAPPPWHNLGTELDNPGTASAAIEEASLDFTVVKRPLDSLLEMPVRHKNFVTVRTDTGEILGVVGDDYEPIQNRDAFAFFDTLVDNNEAMYETAGVIGQGERIWLLARLPGYIRVQGKDIVGKYLLLMNSHDDSSSVLAKLTPIRVVCNNTLAASLKGKGEVHIRNTGDVAEDAEQALALLGMSNSLYSQLDTVFNRMAETRITDVQLRDYISEVVPDKSEDNTEVHGIRRTFLELYESGQGAHLSRGTLWGAFNCVTEYTDHEMERNRDTRLESIWFGRGEQLKRKAFHLAEKMMQS